MKSNSNSVAATTVQTTTGITTTTTSTVVNNTKVEEMIDDDQPVIIKKLDSNNSNNSSDRKLRLRRTDSIAKYKAKQLQQQLQKKLEKNDRGEEYSSDEDDDDDNDKDDDSATSSSSEEQEVPDHTTVTTPPTDDDDNNNNNEEELDNMVDEARTMKKGGGGPPNANETPFDATMVVRRRRDSLDSDDPEFGYEDEPVFTTISRRNPGDESIRPINNPIPNRPVFQVEQINDIVNLSFIALRTSIRVGADEVDSITQDQFELIKKYRVSISEKRTAIKDFSPNVFHNLRNRLNICPTDFLKSWSSFISIDAHRSNSSFFLYSSDKKYILKTLSKSDSIKLRKVLPHYYNNESDKKSHKRKILLDNTIKQTLYKQIEKDTTFLSSHDLLDYSLLVGINRVNSKNEEDKEQQQKEQKEQQQHLQLQHRSSALNLIQQLSPKLVSSTSSAPTTPQLNTPLTNSTNSNNNNNNNNNLPSTASTPVSTGTSLLLSPSPINIEAVAASASTPSSLHSSSSNLTPPATPTIELLDLVTATSATPINNVVIDPIKSVPRLLFFIEEIETVRKSKNLKIGKSLKRSFAVLPRSWSLQDVVLLDNGNSNGNSNSNSATTPDSITSPVLSSSTPSSPLVLSSSTPTSTTTPTIVLSNSLPNVPNVIHRPTAPLSSSPLNPNSHSNNNNNHNQNRNSSDNNQMSSHGSSTNLNGMSNGNNNNNNSSTACSSLNSSSSSITTPTTPPTLHSSLNGIANFGKKKGKNGFYSESKANEIYYFGVVDFLTKYDGKKKISVKSALKPSISNNNPSNYLKKFLNHIKDLLQLQQQPTDK
ncbi:phosphatidylinositol-4-phosphate 5-kinase family protein [Cavenderia fasciculata]|uniref:Phosphatidylinositol-4-phosphate 5-kinase family protein n=1 Tax=Cavenderia fasciculata TaxID=261658 RepID=F4Q0J8_CACFS|nr:phosphatidylinositol-4-phosphate 5-kinase family protein [Cavenderia fasciculata]EGG18349.1 phosphatidylinositol-4-phosphate 5-kinase family protein [Cavenderia fasciculata]|eukprot:XP_004366253.1 phosphatidylinositol-4-phosphate 5-kinase family protein [Cavenderia fasciculata]